MPVKKQSAVVQTAGVPPNTGRTRRPASSSSVNRRNADRPIAVTNSGRPWTPSCADTGVDTLGIEGAEMLGVASEAASDVHVFMRGRWYGTRREHSRVRRSGALAGAICDDRDRHVG